MGGDAKSPQHTVVHPMYVSYSCIPTSASATISPKHTQLNNHQQNSHPFGLNNHNNKTSNTALNTNSSMSSLYNTNNHHQRHQRRLSNLSNTFNNNANHRPDIRYTELSTEQLVQNLTADRDLNAHDNYMLQNLSAFQNTENDDGSHQANNIGYIPLTRPNRIVNNSYHPAYLNNFDSLAGNTEDQDTDSELHSTPPPPPRQLFAQQQQKQQQRNVNNQQQQYHHQQQVYPDMDKYVMPTSYQYVARSPILNRSGSSRRRHENRPHINFVDKIRDAPPGYVSVNNYTSIQRTKSQDRLSQRRQSSQQQRSRPRSYCSNNGNYPEQL